MKGYYLFAPVEPGCVGPQSGVERKVRAQHKALSRHLDCELVTLDPVRYTQSLTERIRRRLPFTAAWRNWHYNGEFDDADFLYIRQVYHDRSFVRWLRDLRRANPDVKIVYEVPTYPYDQQVKIGLSNFPFVLKERLNRKKAAAFVDRIVTFYDQEEIWGKPCFRLMNGFDFSAVTPSCEAKAEGINIVSVSATASWHGYDRLLKGLARYYENGGTENVIYHLVGDVLPNYQSIINEYQLQDHVILYGRLPGDELGRVYEKCQLGVNVLSGYSDSTPVSSSLKSREYGAYGLPFISALVVDYLPEDYPYLLLVPYDDSPLDLERIIRFCHEVYDNNDLPDLIHRIRSYAEARCDISITMKPVCDWLMESV